jgi:GNAT superfamily N-acetyltransferase
METDQLRFEPRRLDDPLVETLVGSYIDEIARSIDDFDPALATPPSVADFDPPTGLFLVAFVDGQAVACGGFRRFTEDAAEIRRMWVSPDARGHGYGTLLLAAIERAAVESGYRTALLDTHGSLEPALALYRSAGYEEVERYNDNPFADHFFKKRLC